MGDESVVLAPITGTEEEVRKANETFAKAWKGLRWPIILAMLSAATGVYVLVTTRDLAKAILPLGLPLGLLWGFRRVLMLREEVRRFENVFSITDEGLKIALRINERSPFSVTTVKWSDVSRVTDEGDAVVLHLRDGGLQRVPGTAFRSKEQRDLLLSRAKHHLAAWLP